MTKVVINRRVGTFRLSQAAIGRLKDEGVRVMRYGDLDGRFTPTNGDDVELTEWELAQQKTMFIVGGLARHDSRLVALVDEMGAAASENGEPFTIVEVGPRYRILEEDDGYENIEEPHTIPWIEVK